MVTHKQFVITGGRFGSWNGCKAYVFSSNCIFTRMDIDRNCRILRMCCFVSYFQYEIIENLWLKFAVYFIRFYFDLNIKFNIICIKLLFKHKLKFIERTIFTLSPDQGPIYDVRIAKKLPTYRHLFGIFWIRLSSFFFSILGFKSTQKHRKKNSTKPNPFCVCKSL